MRWLEGQLRATDDTCTIAFWYRPRFSAVHHTDQEDRAPFWDALRGHAKLIIPVEYSPANTSTPIAS